MSSIIVLDSSDEDEVPSKRSARSIPATITPIKTTIPAALSNTASLLKPPTKPRAIPSGITVTRRSPVLGIGDNATSVGNPVLTQALGSTATQQQAPAATQPPSPQVISNALMKQALSNIAKPQLASLPKINAAFSLSSESVIGEHRQTPTPPKPQHQLPQLQPSPHMRKRKTPTPPSQRNSTHTPPATVTAASATTASSPGDGLLPMICAVQSLTAGATPPQQLMATPPHSAAAAAYNEQQLMINPHLIHTHTHLPSSTSITPQMALNHSGSNSSSTSSDNSNNNNNSFKIHLPPKPRTPATANTPSPAASPVLRTPPLISPPATLNRNVIHSHSHSHHYQQHQHQHPPPPQPHAISASSSSSSSSHHINQQPPAPPPSEKSLRRIKPTTLLRHNDEAWLQQQRQRTLIAFNEDVSMEVLPSTSGGPASTTTAPKIGVGGTPQQDLSITLSPKPARTPPTTSAQTVQALKAFRHTSSVVLDLTASSPESLKSRRATAAAATSNAVLDLTGSPEKLIAGGPSKSSVKLNGETTALAIDHISIASSQETSKNDSITSTPTTTTTNTTTATDGDDEDAPTEDSAPPPPELEPDYAELIKVCREADDSRDMEKLIKTKLLKYYYGVHPDFVRSRGFRKNVRAVIVRIRAEPDLVYYNLKTIVDELKVRRKCKEVVVNNEEASGSTGNKRTDEQIKKLNKALYILTKRIESLEQAEVDWDEEDSSYLQVERFKKRACQIYEKICDLTGESKNAHRLVKKPIQFNATTLPQFNKTLQAYINRTKEFPDYYDVLHMLEHCNRQYAMGLVNFEMKRIAHDAFIKVGKLLQSRRKTDLYETVTHFTANAKDPAATDPTLLAKLSENQKHQTKISEIIEKYAREQDLTAEEQKEARLQEKLKPSTSESQKEENGKNGDEDEDDEEDDDDEEEENANDLEEVVDKLANGDLSDAESDTEVDSKEPLTIVNDSQLLEEVVETAKPSTVLDKHIAAIQDNSANILNNNLARAKTVADTSSAEERKIPNGKVAQNPSSGSSSSSSCLKIRSVSSLCENIVGVNNSDNSRKATPTNVGAVPAPVASAAKPQRTVAEIVISDEEEDGGGGGVARS